MGESDLFVLRGFSKYSDGAFLVFARFVLKMMGESQYFPTPVIPLETLAALIDAFQAALTAARDGGIKAVSMKDKVRGQLDKAMRQLAIYVQSVASGDQAIIASSGFQTRKKTHSPQRQPDTPGIRKILNGQPGELLVYIRAERGAKSYNLRFGPVSIDAELWTVIPVGTVKSAVSIKNLTAGVRYAFQVQAFGNEGLTAWSDTVTEMSK